MPVPAFPLCRHLGDLVLLNQEVAFVFFQRVQLHDRRFGHGTYVFSVSS